MNLSGNLWRGLVVLSCFCSVHALAYTSELYWHNSTNSANQKWSLNELHWRDSDVTIRSTIDFTGSPGADFEMVATADFNRDSVTDLFWRNGKTGQNTIWVMAGSTLDHAVPQPPADPTFSVVGTGDFDGDGYSDVLWTDGHQFVIWYMNGANYRRWDFLPVKTDPTWQLKAVGDFNNDGKPDVLLINPTTRQMGIWYLNGTNLTSSSTLHGAYPNPPGNDDWQVAGVAPLNLLGNSDILWRSPVQNETAAWCMQDDFKLRQVSLPEMTYPDWKIGGRGVYFSNTGRALSATVSGNNLRLAWRLDYSDLPTIYRRDFGKTDWGNPIETNYLPNSLTSTLTPGNRYEYKVGIGNDYILTAVNGRPVEQRGKVILVVENKLTNSLAKEIEMLRTNLVGDGWTVVRTNVPSHLDNNWSANVAGIKSIREFVSNTWSNSPLDNLPQAVLLIGHVPIPHSGYINPDGHGSRALPADGFYGDVDGIFTDNVKSNFCALTDTCPCEPRHDNFPGDGKWDQDHWPANANGIAALEVAVGRIDFANLPVFMSASQVVPKADVELTRQYLLKDDQYRRKRVAPIGRVLTGAYFATSDQNWSIIHEGVRIGSRLFGFAPEVIINGDGFFPGNGSTWSVNGGFGTALHMEGSNNLFHATSLAVNGDVSFVTPGNEPEGAFYSLHGSCFHDFPYSDDLMRALLAVGANFNYGVMWFSAVAGGIMNLDFEQLALGETVGSGFLRSVNEKVGDNVYLNWMGDTTLRIQVLAPPESVRASILGTTVNLSWQRSPEPCQYFVYRSQNNLDGPFVRATAGAIPGPTWVDTAAPSGLNTYMVRGVELRTTGSGSYTNLSQGAFTSISKP